MEKNFLKEFRIPFIGMKNKLYQFDYLIKESFFSFFENSITDNCSIEVKLDFDKKETFFLLTFYIDGWLEVPCDRCLEPYRQNIFDDYEVMVRIGNEENNNTDEDVIYISKNDDFFDVSSLVYEFILLSIPLRCVHPDDENGKSTCNSEVLKKLENKTNKDADPRWAALEKLKNKN